MLSVYRFIQNGSHNGGSRVSGSLNLNEFEIWLILFEVNYMSFDDKIIKMEFTDLEWIIYCRVSMIKWWKWILSTWNELFIVN